jgi:hypothetical protein
MAITSFRSANNQLSNSVVIFCELFNYLSLVN